jgi:hypothetical protein
MNRDDGVRAERRDTLGDRTLQHHHGTIWTKDNPPDVIPVVPRPVAQKWAFDYFPSTTP